MPQVMAGEHPDGVHWLRSWLALLAVRALLRYFVTRARVATVLSCDVGSEVQLHPPAEFVFW